MPDWRQMYEEASQRILELLKETNELRNANQKLGDLLLSPYVFIHESIVSEVDEITKPYVGGGNR